MSLDTTPVTDLQARLDSIRRHAEKIQQTTQNQEVLDLAFMVSYLAILFIHHLKTNDK